jgi:hypothetical protein
MKRDIETTGKQVVVLWFVVVPQYSPGGTEKKTHKETFFRIVGVQAKVEPRIINHLR